MDGGTARIQDYWRCPNFTFEKFAKNPNFCPCAYNLYSNGLAFTTIAKHPSGNSLSTLRMAFGGTRIIRAVTNAVTTCSRHFGGLGPLAANDRPKSTRSESVSSIRN